MTFAARGENLKLGKGSVMFGRWIGQTPPSYFEFTGNATSVALSSDPTTAEKFSSTERTGALIDSRILRVSNTVAVACDEFTMENLRLWLLAGSATKVQSLATDFEVQITDIVLGKYYPLNRRRMTSVEVFRQGGSVALVSGTDYELNTEFGMIRSLPNGAILEGDEITINGNVPALSISQIVIAQESSPIVHMRFLSDDSNNDGVSAHDELNIWKASVSPDGDLGLVSDDYANFSLNFKLLSDATNHPNDPFGTLDRIEA